MKSCSKCGDTKAFSEFHKQPGGRYGLHPRCKDCRRPDITAWGRKRKYGVSSEEYEQLYKSQSGLCAICGESEDGQRVALAVDHDHGTGKVRGLLCSKCNLSLGGFRDDEKILLSAVEYLRNSRIVD